MQLLVHRVGDHWIALDRERFDGERPATGLDLTPGPRAPLIWRYRQAAGQEAAEADAGRLLNVAGWLGGGLVSVSTRGTLYLRKGERGTLALYLPDAPKRVQIGPQQPKTLSEDGRKQPLYPDTWPRKAVQRAIRHRFRTLLVLDTEALLGELGSD